MLGSSVARKFGWTTAPTVITYSVHVGDFDDNILCYGFFFMYIPLFKEIFDSFSLVFIDDGQSYKSLNEKLASFDLDVIVYGLGSFFFESAPFFLL